MSESHFISMAPQETLEAHFIHLWQENGTIGAVVEGTSRASTLASVTTHSQYSNRGYSHVFIYFIYLFICMRRICIQFLFCHSMNYSGINKTIDKELDLLAESTVALILI